MLPNISYTNRLTPCFVLYRGCEGTMVRLAVSAPLPVMAAVTAAKRHSAEQQLAQDQRRRQQQQQRKPKRTRKAIAVEARKVRSRKTRSQRCKEKVTMQRGILLSWVAGNDQYVNIAWMHPFWWQDDSPAG